MKLIYFTKHWPTYSVERLIELGHRVGADGLDLACRNGHTVNPENVREALPEAVRAAEAEGLSIPMLTAEGSFTDPSDPTTEPILAACGESGVRFIKLGYYGWRRDQDYWATVDSIRRKLEAYERLGEKHHVTICYHTHSGGNYGSNCGTLMHLLKGFDPRWIGAYVDTGHMAANGEHWPLGMAMVGEYLKIVGAKTIGYYREPEAEGSKWTQRFVWFREGVVDWTAIFKDLRERGFDGPVTLHGEYDVKMTEEEQIALLADDFQIARQTMGTVFS